MQADIAIQRGYGATAARLTPDQKVGSSNLSGLICHTLAAMASTLCWLDWALRLQSVGLCACSAHSEQ